jgi:hypothetical protein
MPQGKCHGRNEMGCHTAANGGVCFPSCNDDSACPGAYCQPANGVCTKVASGSAWSEIGQPEAAGCHSGVVSGPGGFCTASCTLGVVPTCKWPGPGTKANAACLRGPASPGQGDLGECVQLCDCDNDCHAALTCTALGGSFPMSTGRMGACGTTGTGIACGDAAADSGSDGSADSGLDGG